MKYAIALLSCGLFAIPATACPLVGAGTYASNVQAVHVAAVQHHAVQAVSGNIHVAAVAPVVQVTPVVAAVAVAPVVHVQQVQVQAVAVHHAHVAAAVVAQPVVLQQNVIVKKKRFLRK